MCIIIKQTFFAGQYSGVCILLLMEPNNTKHHGWSFRFSWHFQCKLLSKDTNICLFFFLSFFVEFDGWLTGEETNHLCCFLNQVEVRKDFFSYRLGEWSGNLLNQVFIIKNHLESGCPKNCNIFNSILQRWLVKFWKNLKMGNKILNLHYVKIKLYFVKAFREN